MKMETPMTLRPRPHLGMLMRGVVVADQMNRHIAGYLNVDQLQELQPLLMTMTRLALADDGAVQDVHRGEQRRGAIPFVIVRHRAATSTLKR